MRYRDLFAIITATSTADNIRYSLFGHLWNPWFVELAIGAILIAGGYLIAHLIDGVYAESAP